MELYLTLKKKWFDMIASGEKKEEYREIKKYWISRLCSTSNMLDGCKEFDYIIFKNGYSKDAPTMKVQCLGIDFGEPNPKWTDEPNKECFIIKIQLIK